VSLWYLGSSSPASPAISADYETIFLRSKQINGIIHDDMEMFWWSLSSYLNTTSISEAYNIAVSHVAECMNRQDFEDVGLSFREGLCFGLSQ